MICARGGALQSLNAASRDVALVAVFISTNFFEKVVQIAGSVWPTLS